jgi:hypothetical protein
MSELRQRMIESLQLRGLSGHTQEAYVRAVRQLADVCSTLLRIRKPQSNESAIRNQLSLNTFIGSIFSARRAGR